MNSRTFFEKVALMREAQNDYFRTRSRDALRKSRLWKPKFKAALWMLYSFLGFFVMFGLFILMAITKWGYWVVAGVFTVAMIYGSYKAFYLIFKDDEL